jgi:hypothetical protein
VEIWDSVNEALLEFERLPLLQTCVQSKLLNDRGRSLQTIFYTHKCTSTARISLIVSTNAVLALSICLELAVNLDRSAALDDSPRRVFSTIGVSAIVESGYLG